MDPYAGKVVTEDPKGGLESTAFDLVVGCDGARSVARQAILQQPEVSAETSIIPWLWKFVAFDLKDSYNLRRAFWNVDQCVGGCWHMINNKVCIPISWSINLHF